MYVCRWAFLLLFLFFVSISFRVFFSFFVFVYGQMNYYHCSLCRSVTSTWCIHVCIIKRHVHWPTTLMVRWYAHAHTPRHIVTTWNNVNKLYTCNALCRPTFVLMSFRSVSYLFCFYYFHVITHTLLFPHVFVLFFNLKKKTLP